MSIKMREERFAQIATMFSPFQEQEKESTLSLSPEMKENLKTLFKEMGRTYNSLKFYNCADSSVYNAIEAFTEKHLVDHEKIREHKERFSLIVQIFTNLQKDIGQKKHPKFPHSISSELNQNFIELTDSYLFLERELEEKGFEQYATTYEKIRDFAVGHLREKRIIVEPDLRDKKPKRGVFSYQAAPRESYYKHELMSGALFLVEGITCDCGMAQLIGNKESQEDITTFSFFSVKIKNGCTYKIQLSGVFDGHGGPNVASFIKNHIARLLQEGFSSVMRRLGQGMALTDTVIWNTLKLVFLKISKESPFGREGSTASFSLLIDGEDLWHVNMGDSGSFIASTKKVVRLSEDMVCRFDFPRGLTEKELLARQTEPPLPEATLYEKSIWKRGGFVERYRVNDILMPARDVGNNEVGKGLSGRPKITKISLSKEFVEEDVCFLVKIRYR